MQHGFSHMWELVKFISQEKTVEQWPPKARKRGRRDWINRFQNTARSSRSKPTAVYNNFCKKSEESKGSPH